MTPTQITIIVCSSVASFLFALVIVGVKMMLKGQCTIKTEAKQGRRDIHKKIDPIIELTKELAVCHGLNHPGQLNRRKND